MAKATHYTASDGSKRLIADMDYHHLKNAHRKAVAYEERQHESAFLNGGSYENPEREAEIDAMAAEIVKRDATHAEQQVEG